VGRVALRMRQDQMLNFSGGRDRVGYLTTLDVVGTSRRKSHYRRRGAGGCVDRDPGPTDIACERGFALLFNRVLRRFGSNQPNRRLAIDSSIASTWRDPA
jgi:hypothetical protein